MIRLVLWDIDGTLVHTGGAGQRAFARAFATEFGLANGTAGVSFAGRTDSSLVAECLRQHQIEPTPARLQQFFDAYVLLLEHFLHEKSGAVLPGVWDWIRGLQGLPHRPVIGLLTGNIRLGAEIKLRHFGLWEVFQTGGFGDDHPDRSQIAAVARQRGQALAGQTLQDDEVLVVGDTALDIACARAIQAKVLAVATGGHDLEHLRAHAPDWLVPDLTHACPRHICGG